MSVLYDCLIELQKQIQAMDLPGIPPGNIVLCQVPAVEIPRLTKSRLPAVVIAPFGAETTASASNNRDTVVYPVVVAIVASAVVVDENVNDRQLADFQQRLNWRQTIRRGLSNRRLTQGLVDVIEVQPMPIVDAAAFARDLFVSGVELRLSHRESRG